MRHTAAPRAWQARTTYGLLLCGAIALLAIEPRDFGSHPVTLAVLLALSLCGYVATHDLLARMGRVFDMGAALAVVALAVAGPIGVVAIAVAPDLVHLARRRRAFANIGLVANLVSWVGAAAVGGAVLDSIHPGGLVQRGEILLLAGAMMILANFVLARLLLAVIRDRENPLRLIRCELIGALPLELLAVGVGIFCSLLLPSVGVPVFVAFTALAYLPQLAAAQLLRAPSVAALPIDDAATVYRDALADELGLSRADRRQVHLIDALAQRRTLPAAPSSPPTAIQDALLVTICSSRAPTQRHFTATTRPQVVLVARRWAELTARCTPALNHREALVELRRSGLAQDAPAALTAAAAIIEREAALTEHVAGVPRLHRAPLPRMLRHDVLPVALGRLAA